MRFWPWILHKTFPDPLPRTLTPTKKPNVSWLYSHGTQNFGILHQPKTKHVNTRTFAYIMTSDPHNTETEILKVKIRHKTPIYWAHWSDCGRKSKLLNGNNQAVIEATTWLQAPRISSWKASYFSATQVMAWVMWLPVPQVKNSIKETQVILGSEPAQWPWDRL